MGVCVERQNVSAITYSMEQLDATCTAPTTAANAGMTSEMGAMVRRSDIPRYRCGTILSVFSVGYGRLGLVSRFVPSLHHAPARE